MIRRDCDIHGAKVAPPWKVYAIAVIIGAGIAVALRTCVPDTAAAPITDAPQPTVCVPVAVPRPKVNA